MCTVPTGWSQTSIGDVALLLRNGLFASRPVDQPPGTRILRISAVRGGRVDLDDAKYVRDLPPDQAERYQVREGDLLFTRYNGSRHLVGICGRVGPHEVATIHPDKLIRVVVDPAVADSRFVGLQMAAPATRRFLEPRIRTTAGQSGISGKDLRAIPVSLPTLEEQRRIVEILEDHLSCLDAADRTVRVGRDAISLVRLSALVHARRAMVEQGVHVRPIGDVCDTTLGKMLNARKASGAPTPYLRNINVRWGQVDASDVWTVPLTDAERERFALTPGDVLVCEGGEPGRCAVWTGSSVDMTFQKALHRLRVRDGAAEPQFVAAMIEEAVRSGRADELFTGTTIKHLPQEKLRALGIPVPDLSLQHLLLAELQELDSSAERLDAAVSVVGARSGGLRRALLAAAFSGGLSQRSGVEAVQELADD